MHYHQPQDFQLMPQLSKAFPAGMEKWGDLGNAVFDPADETLSVLHRQLIAIAVAATTQCPYCMEAHIKAAKEAGASQEQVARAVMVASALRAGAAMTHGWLAMKIYEQGDELTEYTSPQDKKYHRSLRQHAGGAVEALGQLDAVVFDPDDEVLPLKIRELMAIAVAATTQCPYCMEAHVTAAKKAGASQDEVARAVLVAADLRSGGGVGHGLLALKLHDGE